MLEGGRGRRPNRGEVGTRAVGYPSKRIYCVHSSLLTQGRRMYGAEMLSASSECVVVVFPTTLVKAYIKAGSFLF